jgi:hypothetical protein
MDNVEQAVAYIKSLNLQIVAPTLYGHMGAVLVDASLRTGMNYERVLMPRVAKIAAIEAGRTTTGFVGLLARQSLEDLLSWRPGPKPTLIRNLTQLLVAERVETVSDLAAWLQRPEGPPTLLSIKGIGPKTVDYMKGLVGCDAVAIYDVHLVKFLRHAGIATKNYREARTVVESAADRLGIDRGRLDQSIWKFMSRNTSP